MSLLNEARSLVTSILRRRERRTGYSVPIGEEEFGRHSVVDSAIPPWTLYAVPRMLKDEFVTFATELIVGPIVSNSKIKVVAEDPAETPFGQEPGPETEPQPEQIENPANPPKLDEEGNPVELPPIEIPPEKETDALPAEVEKFIRENVDIFVERGLPSVVRGAIQYGFGPHEVCYEMRDGIPYLDRFERISPFRAEPCVDASGRIYRVKVRGVDGSGAPVYLGSIGGIRKWIWPVHERGKDRWYGESRYRAAYSHFYMKWAKKGYRELLRIWLTKAAFHVGLVRFPSNRRSIDNGQFSDDVPADKRALDFINQMVSGSAAALPSDTDGEGNFLWDWTPGNLQGPPQSMQDAVNDCDDRILIAMGVPPELARNFSNAAFGSASGRAVPETAFYSTLLGIVRPLVEDFETQVLKPLVKARFGRSYSFRLSIEDLFGTEETPQPSDKNPPFQSEEISVPPSSVPGSGSEESGSESPDSDE